jgi:hypothetical protein
VDKIKLSIIGNVPKNGVIVLKGYMVPSHMGNLQRHAILLQILGETFNGTWDNAQASRVVLFAIFKDNLRSETDAQYGLPSVYPFRYPSVQMRLSQIGHSLACGTNTGEDYATGLLQYLGIITDTARLS